MIYFMQPAEGGPVKIGYSDDVDARHRQLEKDYKRALVVLATMPGGADEEREIHDRFDHLRFDGARRVGVRPEQFRPATELMEFIGRPLFVNQGDVELMEGQGGTQVRIDSDLATKGKYVAAQRGSSLAEFLSEILRPAIEREFRKVGRNLVGGDE